ncbi:unnamed protein product, partial [Cuscuta epithymum]
MSPNLIQKRSCDLPSTSVSSNHPDNILHDTNVASCSYFTQDLDIDDVDVDDAYVDYEDLKSINDESSIELWDIGDPNCVCPFCEALFWYEERIESSSTKMNPKYSLCCSQNKVQLPVNKEPPLLLQRLMDGTDAR